MNVLDSSSNFLSITEPEFSTYENSKCIIQQLPNEYSSSYGQGSSKGPEAILTASHYVEYYDIELDAESYKKCGIATLADYALDNENPAALMQAICNATTEHLKNSKFVVSLGAEHSLTYGIYEAFHQHYPDLGILQIDAHSDLRESYQGSKWSHASVMARICELNSPIFQVGIRAQCIEESLKMKQNPLIHCWYDKDIHQNDLWMDEVVSRLPKNLYITLDADGFNAEVCPSVGTIEPGGLAWYQSLKFLRKVFKACNVVGFDIVELSPENEKDRTAYNMAQLCYKLIGYKFN